MKLSGEDFAVSKVNLYEQIADRLETWILANSFEGQKKLPSEQALADMLGFLKQHLSDAQIAKINGEPKLLEQELVTYFFGGTFEHISFYAAPDLFA